MWSAIVISIVSFAITTLSVHWLVRSRHSRFALDKPNTRSLHSTPVPRTGGIGLLLGIAAGWFFVGPQFPWSFWIALTLIIVVSLLDDLRGLSAAIRLVAHLLAAALAAPALVGIHDGWLFPAAILAIGWMCNLYNFMDGSDGLAGGMAIFGFLFFSIAAALAGDSQFALLNLAIAVAAAGFLPHNFHPARIFLGDAGSVPLGFLAATFGIIGWMQQYWGWWFPLLVFSPFIVDASVTLAKRLLSGARVWEAHRDHYYQRLVQLGLGHRDTALAEYTMMATCGLAAMGAMTLNSDMLQLALAGIGIMYAVIIIGIELAWRKREA